MAPVIRCFLTNPATRDNRIVEQEVMRWTDGLAALAHFARFPFSEVEAAVSLADCVWRCHCIGSASPGCWPEAIL
jgi:hypothetical protein